MNFLDRFSKNTQISNFVKIRLAEAELYHVDGQADRQTDRNEEAYSSFFANATKSELVLLKITKNP